MPRLLVTGGAGFIGSNFVHHWAQTHPGQRIVVLDAVTYASNLENLKPLEGDPDFRFVQGTICDSALVESLLREECLDTILNFAAESHVDRSIDGPDAFIETNVIGTHSLLKSARRVWLDEHTVDEHRFHHVSTDEVYGSLELHAPAFDEHSPYAPNSPYSASKAASDHLVRAYYHTYGLRTTTSHCSNNYGPYHFPEKLIPLVIVNILEGKALPIYGDGRHRRDWLHVSDHCRGIELILQRGKPGEVYNIGGGDECENLQLIDRLCRIADEILSAHPDLPSKYPRCPVALGQPTSSLVRFVRDRAGHDRRYSVNTEKIRRELGYQAKTLLDRGLRETFNWYLQNEKWWRGVMDAGYDGWIRRHYRFDSV